MRRKKHPAEEIVAKLRQVDGLVSLSRKVAEAIRSIEVTAVEDGAAPTAAIVALALQYGRYGYRRITALLRREGWRVNVKRVDPSTGSG